MQPHKQDNTFDIIEKRRSFTTQSMIEVIQDIEERKQLGTNQQQAIESLLGNLNTISEKLSNSYAIPREAQFEIRNAIERLTQERERSRIETFREEINLKRELRTLLDDYWRLPTP